MFENQQAPEPKFKKGQRVWHNNRDEWVTLMSEGQLSEKRWNDYGVIELEYDAQNDDGNWCWGYEADFSETKSRWGW